jgi:hypothetical protein
MFSESLALAGANLLSPVLLFFVLGLAAALVRSDLSIPEAFSKGISLFLILSIGFKGGVAVSTNGLDSQMIATGLVGIALSFLMPFLGFAILRRMTGLSIVDAAAVAAHYGSVSLVTFIAATALLTTAGIVSNPAMVAVLAVMETPAILAGLLLARRAAAPSPSGIKPGAGVIAHEVFLNGAVVLLLGAFAIGALSGERGMTALAPFVVAPFQGVLCIFMLDMGLVAGARLLASGSRLGAGTLAFGIIMPVIGATLGAISAGLIGLGTGDAMLLITLAASASYIAVPAALRLALPQADAGIYLTLALAVTFPFNLTIGLPLYLAIALSLQG